MQHKEELLYCMGDRGLEEAAQRACGFSGDIQKQSECFLPC